MQDHSELKNQLLMTLSFYEPMTMEFIYLDLDQDFLIDNPNLTVEDLKNELVILEKEKKIKKLKDPESWIRLHPKKSLFKRLKSLFK